MSEDEEIEILQTIQVEQKIPRIYETNCEYRGIAIIAVFHTFHKKVNLDALNFKKDLEMLEAAFKLQQYKVEVWQDAEDLTKDEFLKKLKEVAKDPLQKDYETFAMIIITRGKPGALMHAYDKEFTMEDVYINFDAEHCEALKMKPKIFVFHGCLKKPAKKDIHASGWYKEKGKGVSIPVEADMLILFSNLEGNLELGAAENGSAFINALTEALNKDYEKEDNKENILELMTTVCRQTAKRKNESQGEIKQQPILISTLLSLYYLKKKRDISAC